MLSTLRLSAGPLNLYLKNGDGMIHILDKCTNNCEVLIPNSYRSNKFIAGRAT